MTTDRPALPAAALDGVRVLELGEGTSVPFAARLLADLGADVVKVESPSGDRTRRWGPRLDAEGARGALFEYLNWNKRSVRLDPADPADRAQLSGLIGRADIVFAGDDADALSRWGMDAEGLRDEHPRVAFVTVSAFGTTGPYSGWEGTDLIVQAMSGLMSISGTIDREPVKRGLRQSAYTTGLTAAYSALVAHISAVRYGGGAHADVAAREVVAAELILNGPSYTCMGAIQTRRLATKDPFTGEPVPVKDGYGALQTNTWTTLEMFADLLEEPELATDRFDGRFARSANGEELTALLVGALRDWTGRELFTRASSRGLLTGFVQRAGQLLACPHLEERGTLYTVPGSEGALGSWRFPAVLGHLSATPTSVRTPAPALGEHPDVDWPQRHEVVSSLPATPADDPSGTPAGPLSGLRVVDLSSVVAAPLIGGMLRDLGADVLRVEPPNRLDQSRGEQFGPIFGNDVSGDWWNRSGSFQSMNRGKRSIALDLKQEEGREILRRLVADADVLLENYTPRILRSWGLTYDELKQINPNLIMLSNTGYGSTGPWSEFKAQGTTLEYTMGAGSYSGYADEKPTKVGQSYPDFVSAWSGLTALLAAIVHHDRTGQGQWIDLGMYQLGGSMTPEAFVAVQSSGTDLAPIGNAEIDTLLSTVVPAAGEDRWLAVAITDSSVWDAAAAMIPGFPASDGNPPDEAALVGARAALARWAAQRAALEAATLLQDGGVPAGPVNDARDMLLDRQLIARRFYEPIDFGDQFGLMPVLSRGFRWFGEGAFIGVRGPGPRFGAHNDDVLASLGYDAERRQELRDRRVIVDEPIDPPSLGPVDVEVALRTSQYSEIDPDYRSVVADVLAQQAAGLALS